jgi:molecular chaperone DnaK (HSP70)
MASAPDLTICIDFGTAWSKAVALVRGEDGASDPAQIRPLLLSSNTRSSPLILRSLLFVDDDRVYFGEDAWARALAVDPSKDRQAFTSFKTLLAARDLARALEARAQKRIDPQRRFTLRDLLVLYFAFLMLRVERGHRADPAIASIPHARLRYTHPAWGGAEDEDRHRYIPRLIDEGAYIAQTIGGEIENEAGLRVDVALEALARAAGASLSSRIEGVVFEAAAVAACRLADRAPSARHMLVIDIGAGTTDLGGYRLRSENAIEEIVPARRTVDIAGDVIDRVLMNAMLSRARHVRSNDAQTSLWRTIAPQVRELKEALFTSGKCAVRYERKIVTLSAKDVVKQEDFKGALAQIRDAYAITLSNVARVSLENNMRDIDVVFAGGGASLPFLHQMARDTKPAPKLNPHVHVAPLAPKWAHADHFQGQLVPVFPQISIAAGGALAPNSLVSRPRERALAS